MNKTELIKAIASEAGITKDAAGKALDAALQAIIDDVAAGNKMTLIGFGTFEPRKRAARQGTNPQTGETIQIPEAVTPAFKAGRTFKDALKK